MARPVAPVATWARITTLLLSLAGLDLSTYLTIEHFGHSNLLVCPHNTLFNCLSVTTSAQSYFFGIPVAVLGLVSFLVMTALNTPWAWNAKQYWLHVARFVLAIGSMGFVLWLIAAELVIIDHICLYCTAVHFITFVLLIVLTQVSPKQLGWVSRSAN